MRVIASIAESMDLAKKVRVQWIDCGRSSGKESFVSRRSIQEQNSNFRAGQRVKVKWGKSNKLFSAEILSDDEAPVVEETPTKELPRQSTTAIGRRLPTDLFTFELDSGSTNAQEDEEQRSFSLPSQLPSLPRSPISANHSLLLQKEISEISSSLRSIEADTNRRLQAIEVKLEELLRAFAAKNDRLSIIEEMVGGLSEAAVKSEIDLLCQSASVSSPINLDASTVQPVADQAYRIPPGILSESLEACRGQRNFAGRLAQKLFSEEERRGSNVRGVLGKKALDTKRMNGIRDACFKQYPACHGETRESVLKEIRISVNEVCRRKKATNEKKEPLTLSNAENILA